MYEFLWFHCLPSPIILKLKIIVGEEINFSSTELQSSYRRLQSLRPNNLYLDTPYYFSRSMQSSQKDRCDDVTLMKLLNKVHVHEAQLNLLQQTISNDTLLRSKILSSIQPKVGRKFSNSLIENQKQRILLNARKQLLKLAIKDIEATLQQGELWFWRKEARNNINF